MICLIKTHCSDLITNANNEIPWHYHRQNWIGCWQQSRFLNHEILRTVNPPWIRAGFEKWFRTLKQSKCYKFWKEFYLVFSSLKIIIVKVICSNYEDWAVGWVAGWCNESYYSNYYTFKVIPPLIPSQQTILGISVKSCYNNCSQSLVTKVGIKSIPRTQFKFNLQKWTLKFWSFWELDIRK